MNRSHVQPEFRRVLCIRTSGSNFRGAATKWKVQVFEPPMAWVVGALVIFNLIWTFDFYIIFGSLFYLKLDFWKLRDNFIEYIHTKKKNIYK
jgi:hypothetical protein